MIQNNATCTQGAQRGRQPAAVGAAPNAVQEGSVRAVPGGVLEYPCW